MMAAQLIEHTCEGGENQSDEEVDYVELLRSRLRQKKLIYIADVILELEEITLEQLMKWTRSDLIELVADIHNDEDNNHQIKVVHRNKFADAVIDIQTKQNEALQNEVAAPSAESTADSSTAKLFFLGQEEEEAIESIQSAQQFIEQKLLQMKKSFANLEENKKNATEHLEKICTSLKQEIDEKQKRMLSTMNIIYHFHLNELKERKSTTQQSAKVIAKFYNDYQSYFTNDTLTKTDRKQKLIAVKTSVAEEVEKIKKQKDVAYNMEVLLDQEKVDRFVKEFLKLKQIGITLTALNPPVLVPHKRAVITWNEPQLNNNWMAIIKQENEDHKEEMNASIDYHVLYQKTNELCDVNQTASLFSEADLDEIANDTQKETKRGSGGWFGWTKKKHIKKIPTKKQSSSSCSCGATLVYVDVKNTYKGKKVYCDICNKRCKQYVFHCPSGHIKSHPDGFDLCSACGESQSVKQQNPRAQKENDEWNRIIVKGRDMKQYDMKQYVPCKVAIQYTINDVVQSSISKTIEIKPPYVAVWSAKYKSNKIILSENKTKAHSNGDGAIRAENPIKKGMMVTLDYICGGGRKRMEIIGVISSEFGAFKESEGPYDDTSMCKYCYGADCYRYTDANKHYYGEYKDLGWSLGDATEKENVTVQMIVDYSTYDTCCLSFYINGEFKGPRNAKYSMKLPKLDNGRVWYPVTSFFNSDRWCKIVCVE